MQSSHLLRYGLNKDCGKVIIFITALLRTAVGVLFIFSGFVKGIDPWGTVYKLNEYFNVLGIPVWHNLLVAGSFILSGLEFAVGVFLLLGCFRRGSALLSFLFMCVMFPLTVWIALKNPVNDCGCFGDALVISNKATMWKNLFLIIATFWLLRFNKRVGWLITPAIQWIGLILTAAFIFVVEFIGYYSQPLLDFRPYPVGTSIVSNSTHADSEESRYEYVYSKDGKEMSFSADSLPDESEGWVFIDRKEVESKPVIKPVANIVLSNPIHVWDGDEEVTDEVIVGDNDQLLLLIPALSDVSVSTTWKINSLYDWSKRNDIEMISVVSGSASDIEVWKDLANCEYPVYTSDDTMLKEIARGNPSVVYTRNGVIKWKHSLASLRGEDFEDANVNPKPISFVSNGKDLLLRLSAIFVSALMLLVSLSLFAKFDHFPTLRRYHAWHMPHFRK